MSTMTRSRNKNPPIAIGTPRANIIAIVFSKIFVVFSLSAWFLESIGKREMAMNDGTIAVNCTRRCAAAYKPTSDADFICPSMMLSRLKMKENNPMMMSGQEKS